MAHGKNITEAIPSPYGRQATAPTSTHTVTKYTLGHIPIHPTHPHFHCKGSLCFREMTSRPALIPFCPQDFPFRFPVWRVHAPRHPPPQKFFCTLLYISIAHMSHNICHFCASERTIHCECFALHSRALVFATRRFLLLLLLSRASRHHVLTY